MKNTIITDVFFDLDHTLWDFDKNSELTFEKIFNNRFPEVQTAHFIEHYVPINQECWKLYQFDKITHDELRYNRLKQSFDAIGYHITDADIESVSNDYIALLPENNHLFEGAFEILDYLSDRYQLHIITNGFAKVQEKKMANSNLLKYFKTLTNSELAGVKKPNTAIFEYALEVANTSKDRSVMIGDSLEADVYGALNAGLDAIFFNEAKLEVPIDIKHITHLLDLKKHL